MKMFGFRRGTLARKIHDFQDGGAGASHVPVIPPQKASPSTRATVTRKSQSRDFS